MKTLVIFILFFITIYAQPQKNDYYSIEWGNTQERKIIYQQTPDYPESNAFEIDIRISFTIQNDGSVKNISIVNHRVPALEKAAVNALKMWKFDSITDWQKQAEQNVEIVFYYRAQWIAKSGSTLSSGESESKSENSLLPPELIVSISFSDENSNNFLEGNENGSIVLKVINVGKGKAIGVLFEIEDQLEDINLSFPKLINVGTILPGSEKNVVIELKANKGLQKSEHVFVIKGIEGNGFNPPIAKISFETLPLIPPDIIISDYVITSNRGDNLIRSGEITDLKIRFLNIGSGIAQKSNFTVQLPPNVFFTPDSKNSGYYEKILQGEFVDLDISIVLNNLVKNEIQLNFVVDEKNFKTKLPLNLLINKRQNENQELVIRGEENRTGNKEFTSLSVDIENNIPQTHIKKNNAVALVVGISDYQNSNVSKVTYAKRDASLIRQYLEKSFGFDERDILPRNEDELMTSGTIKNYIKNVIPSYLRQDGSSELFIYLTGHGAPSTKTRNAYFVPYDCDPNYVSDINAYNMNEFYDDIEKLNAQKKIVVIDACFSGQSGDGNMLIKDASPIYVTMENEMNLDDKSIMFLSSGADQVSNWYPEKKHSMFTYFFLKGLQGDADLNKDGAISVSELENYINDENNGLPYYSNREFQRPQKAVIRGRETNIILDSIK